MVHQPKESTEFRRNDRGMRARVASALIRADFKLFLKWKRLSKVTLNVNSYFGG